MCSIVPVTVGFRVSSVEYLKEASASHGNTQNNYPKFKEPHMPWNSPP